MGKELKLWVDGNELSKDGIKERFDRYNNQYFGGVLGTCSFFWLNAEPGFNGKYAEMCTSDGKVHSQIGINRKIHWTEEGFRDLLVHEMIHMYVSTIDGKKHDGLFGHGRHFRAQCKRLKAEFGLDIKAHGGLGRTDKQLSLKLWEKIVLWIIDR